MKEESSSPMAMILVIIVSITVFFVWQAIFPQTKNQPNNNQITTTTSDQSSSKTDIMSFVTNNNRNYSENADTSVTESDLKALQSSHRVKFSNPYIVGSINLQGASIDSVTLLHYKQTIDKNSPNIYLLHPNGSNNAYFYKSGFVSDSKSFKIPNDKTLWTTSSTDLKPDHPIVLTYDNHSGLIFKKIISIDSKYMIFIRDVIINKTGKSVSIYPWAYIVRQGEPKVNNMFISHEGPVGYFSNENQSFSYGDIQSNSSMSFNNHGSSYFGFANKYFMVSIIPDIQHNSIIKFNYFEHNNLPHYQADYVGNNYKLDPSQSYTNETKLFVGPKKLNILKNYSSQYHINNFQNSIDFGWFFFITKPFFSVLVYFNNLFGNFAYAMLIFTILIRLLVFPITYTAYSSMAKMRKLQPEMKALKETYSNDRMHYNKAIMDLYRKYKINPLAGCLPMLIQIPILFSIYKVIYISIEMRQATFWWIRDLSAPDPTSIFNLFGLLPYSVPSFLHIGFWAIFMGVTLYLQQKFSNTQITNETHKRIMKWFPVILTFVLSGFPVGLLIYWCWSNLITVLQQFFINRSINKQDLRTMINRKK